MLSGINLSTTGNNVVLSGVSTTIKGDTLSLNTPNYLNLTGTTLNLTSNNVLNLNSSGNVIIKGQNILFNGTVTFDSINVQNWMPYKLFDVYTQSGVGIAKTSQELISGIPNYYWEFSNVNAGDFILTCDLDNVVITRDTTNKGYLLQKISVNYSVLSGSLSGSVSIIKNEVSNLGVRTSSIIPVSGGNLSGSVGVYYSDVTVISPVTMNFNEMISIQIRFIKNTNTILKFYGATFGFKYNPL